MKELPYQVGITGGIGSGKSTVCKLFQALGIPVYEADIRAKWLMVNDPWLRKELVGAFGESTYLADGSLNRRYLAEQVFGSNNKVNELNALVHPRVREDAHQWALEQTYAPYVLREIPLLFETNAEKTLKASITVAAPEKLRILRVRNRDPQRTEDEIKGIISKQLSEAERQAKADYVIHNDEEQMLIPQVIALHKRLSEIVKQWTT